MRKTKAITVLLILCLAAFVVLSGCGGNKNEASSPEQASGNASENASETPSAQASPEASKLGGKSFSGPCGAIRNPNPK